jgi:hypothetical protein
LLFQWTLEDFDVRVPPSIGQRQVRELATLIFINEAANILVLGPPSGGKTSLAVALGLRAIEQLRGMRGEVLGDAVIATAILDRLLHHRHVHHRHVLNIGESSCLKEKQRTGLIGVSTVPPVVTLQQDGATTISRGWVNSKWRRQFKSTLVLTVPLEMTASDTWSCV